MGIDQSYTSCGVVVLDESGTVLASQIFQTDRKTSDFQRSWSLYQRLLNLVQIHEVKYLAIEGLAFGKCGNATRSLAILQGVLVTNLQYLRTNEFNNQIERLEIITPSSLKKWATGNGRADKRAIIAQVPIDLLTEWRKVYPTKSIDDLADAYFLATKIRHLHLQTIQSIGKTRIILRLKPRSI